MPAYASHSLDYQTLKLGPRIHDERQRQGLTLQELGDRFGISRERVRQLEQRLTMRLRDYLREEMGDATEVV